VEDQSGIGDSLLSDANSRHVDGWMSSKNERRKKSNHYWIGDWTKASPCDAIGW
jgi:hypothetical protein